MIVSICFHIYINSELFHAMKEKTRSTEGRGGSEECTMRLTHGPVQYNDCSRLPGYSPELSAVSDIAKTRVLNNEKEDLPSGG